MTSFSTDDVKRNEIYQENAKRSRTQSMFSDYGEYLKILEMKAEIDSFVPLYMERIA